VPLTCGVQAVDKSIYFINVFIFIIIYTIINLFWSVFKTLRASKSIIQWTAPTLGTPNVHKKVNNYLLSIGRLAVHQFIMEKYITLFTFTGLSFKGKSLLCCGSDHRRA